MKNKRLPNWRLIGAGLLFALAACQKDSIDEPAEIAEVDEIESENMIELGDQLPNPYSVANMQKALENLRKNSTHDKTAKDQKIETTHLYVKFMPKSEEQLDILKQDTTLFLYDYPLDRKIIGNGNSYHDPNVPKDQPTPQYASIAISKKLPKGINYLVLEKLYIPDDYGDFTTGKSNSSTSKAFVDDLVYESLRLTGNLEEDEKSESSLTAKDSWTPDGTIRVWDDNLNTHVGVAGLRVKVRRWFTTHTGFTNTSGYFRCDGSFKRDANYLFQWERYEFEIRDGALSRAEYKGPDKTGSWNLDIRNGAQEFYGTIFRAAHYYYYGNINNLRRPPNNGVLKTQLKIRAYNESNSEINGSHSPSRRFLGLGSAIFMYNPARDSQDTYGTVIHELAHASHWNMDGSSYRNASTIVLESWARGVQWEITRKTYPTYQPPYFTNYTGVVQDMIDGTGVDDLVSGYQIRQIEDALDGQTSWTGWRNNIKNRYTNATENNLDALFAFWD